MRFLIFALAALAATVAPADPAIARADLRTALGDTVLAAPRYYPAPEMDQGPVKAIFYDALPYGGHPTRAFAYLAIPEGTVGQKLPGMVLVHGGGGTAFHEWAKIWYDKGYAAIAMDLEGQIPQNDFPNRPRHAFSGPLRTGMFDDVDKPRNEQWMFHAVADIMLANSLLRALPGVDPARIGLTGISWGGVLSSLVGGLDERFVFSAPVYGCGYLYDSKGYFNRMGAKDDASLELRKFWDPARYFTDASMPMLWVNGDNDPHFSVDTMSHSHTSAGPASILSIHPRMPHGHSPGWEPDAVPEIYALAEHLLKGSGAPLPRITNQPELMEGGRVLLHFESERPIVFAGLYYLTSPLEYAESAELKHLDLVHPFETIRADIDTTEKSVAASLPEGCTWYYINLVDDRGCIVSSNLMELEPG
jgi:dienelactone hydrolase